MSQNKSVVKVVFIALLIDLFSFTIILPLYPRIIRHYVSISKDSLLLKSIIYQLNQFKSFLTFSTRNKMTRNEDKKLEITLLGGAIGSLFSLCQFVASPVIGYLADVFGRKNTLLFSLFGNLTSNLVWGFSNSFETFVLARIIGGLSEGSSQLSTTIIADVTNKENRSSSLALVGIAFSIAFTLGPLLGALSLSDMVVSFLKKFVSGSSSFAPAALLATTLIVVELLYVYYKLHETLPKKNKLIKKIKKLEKFPKHQKLTNLNTIYFAYTLIFSGLEFTVPFLAYNKFMYNSNKQGIMFMYIGIISSILQAGYVRRNKANKEYKLIFSGFLSCTLSLLFFGLCVRFTGNYARALFYMGITCMSITSAFVVVSLNSSLSLAIDNLGYPYDQRKGAIQGVYRSYGQLGRIFGPVTYCSIYWLYGPCICYIFGGISTVVLIAFSLKAISGNNSRRKFKLK